MPIKSATEHIFDQISWLLAQVSNNEYTQSITHLNGSTIGQHVRHTLEFFKCLLDGLEKATVNYDARQRDIFLESNTLEAKGVLDELRASLDKLPNDMDLTMIQSYGDAAPIKIASNLKREMVYNIEHAVHHLALIRVALKEIKPDLSLDESFGLASSTLQYRKSLTDQNLAS